ncbi:MAG: hypothetical protein CYG60_24770 [Actinobacteria bacterium]|nr:MAG: hypothetical protein CYG60_24770 [Actinomycetota bacterium]
MTDTVTDIGSARGYTVRPLNNGDIFRAARLVAAITNDGRIYHAMGQTQPKVDEDGNVVGTEMNQQAVGVALFGAAMAQAPQELQKFLADLVGMDEDAFNKLPMTATPEILEEIMDREDFASFLASAYRLSGVAKKAFGVLRTNTSNGTA